MGKSKKSQFNAELTDPEGSKIIVRLDVLQFKEEGCYFFYAPYLDLYGYGRTKAKARESFEIAIEEFFNYTIEKGTLEKELFKLGWRKKDEMLVPPHLDTSKPEISDIISNHQTNLSGKKIEIPATP